MKTFFTISVAAFLIMQSSLTTKAQELWGMTKNGGADDTGVIYKTDSTGNNYSVQFQFSDDTYGCTPVSGVVLYDDDNLWGLTKRGGTNDVGTRYEYNISHSYFAKREDFVGDTKGAYPKGNLTKISASLYYGTTNKGGVNDQGAIYKLDAGLQTIVYSFNAAQNNNFCYPVGTMAYYDGNLYGVYREYSIAAYQSFGIFKYNISSNVLTHLGSLGNVDTHYYYDSRSFLNFAGDHSKLYIALEKDIYSYDMSTGNLNIVISSADTGWDHIDAFMKKSNNAFYAAVDNNFIQLNLTNGTYEVICTSAQNIAEAANGKIYIFSDAKITEFNAGDKSYMVVHTFTPSPTNDDTYTEFSFSGDIARKDNFLYGTTEVNGKYDKGTLFSFNTTTYEFNIIHDFKGAIGNHPSGKLMKYEDGRLYGLASNGNHTDAGSIFSFNPVKKEIRVLHYFGYDRYGAEISDDGEEPMGGLTSYVKDDNKYMLGTTSAGGTNLYGTIFYYSSSPYWGYKKIVDFSGTNGKNPYGNLVSASDGNVYGVTFSGGTNGDGVVFRLTHGNSYDSFAYSVIYNFGDNTNDGSGPLSGLTEYSNFLWGVTHNGGANSKGTVFAYYLPSGTYFKQADFNGSNGENPIGNLVPFGGKLYGVTRAGGAYGHGTIFEYNLQSGAITVKHSFNTDGNGYEPMGGLTLSKDKLYGVCAKGGSSSRGVMFEYDLTTGTVTVKKNFTGTNGADVAYNNALLSTCTAHEIIPDLVNLPVISAQCEVDELDTPTAKTNCGDIITGKLDTTLPITGQGTHTITWTYKDNLGNVDTQEQTVIIDDTTDPVPVVASLPDLHGDCSIYDPMKNSPKATDNCKGTFYGTADVTFPITTEGTTVITWTYDDENGNVATQTQNAIVGIDNTVTVNGITITAEATGNYTYQWYKRAGDWVILLQGENSRSYAADASGTYYVEIDNGSCSTTSGDVAITVTGIINVKEKYGISIYPNPTNGLLNIKNENSSEITISVYNVAGNMIENIKTADQTTKIHLDQYAKGIYFVLINNGTETISQKVVKK